MKQKTAIRTICIVGILAILLGAILPAFAG